MNAIRLRSLILALPLYSGLQDSKAKAGPGNHFEKDRMFFRINPNKKDIKAFFKNPLGL